MNHTLEYGWRMSVGKLAGTDDPNRVRRVLGLFNALPQFLPCEVLALEKALHSPAMFGVNLRVLVLRGWSAEVSALLYKNFRFMHPLLKIDPTMWKVMSRAQLIDELGHAVGMAVADLHCDPGSNVIFEAFLHGLKNDTVVRPARFCDVMVPDEMGQELKVELGSKDLPYTLASRIYRDCTGQEPEAVFETDLSPLRVDYEELAKIGQAVRPPNRHW